MSILGQILKRKRRQVPFAFTNGSALRRAYCFRISRPCATTELGYMARLQPEFDKSNTTIIGLSVDAVGDHARWANDIKEPLGCASNYPIIGDPDLEQVRICSTPAQPATVERPNPLGVDNRYQMVHKGVLCRKQWVVHCRCSNGLKSLGGFDGFTSSGPL